MGETASGSTTAKVATADCETAAHMDDSQENTRENTGISVDSDMQSAEQLLARISLLEEKLWHAHGALNRALTARSSSSRTGASSTSSPRRVHFEAALTTAASLLHEQRNGITNGIMGKNVPRVSKSPDLSAKTSSDHANFGQRRHWPDLE